MNKKLKLLTITAVSAAVVLCSAGVTLAVVTSDNRSSGSLTTADLDLSARATNIKVYSAAPAAAGATDVFYDEHGAAYQYEQSITQGDLAQISFSRHDGNVSFNDKSVTIDGILPGDKVEFDIAVTSTSTISFHYRAELYVDAAEGTALLNQLDFSAGSLGLRRQDVTDEGTAKDENLSAAVLTDYTEWTTFGGNQASIENIHVTVSLPMTATEGQGETLRLYYVASGIQNTELQADVAQVTLGEETKKFKSLAEAVAFAEENGIGEISVIGNTLLEEGAVNVSSAIRFVGVERDGFLPVIKGARIAVIKGAAATFENIRFVGESYIDVSYCAALTLNGCTADGTAVKYFDADARNYLPDAAFIVSGSSLSSTRLTLANNLISVQKGAAICMRSQMKDGSSFRGNDFGAENNVYGGTAAVSLGGAESGAVVRMENNKFYGNTALAFDSGNHGRFTVISNANKAFGVTGALVGGVSDAALLDSGTTVDGNALQCKDLVGSSLLLGGTDVTLDELGKILFGKIILAEGLQTADFRANYVAVGISRNAIALYDGQGTLYAYLNSANNEVGFVIDIIRG